MAIYLIACELRNGRNYDALWRQMTRWKCVEVTRTMWLAELVGPASAIYELIAGHLDQQDRLAVFEINHGSEWIAGAMDSRAMAWIATKLGRDQSWRPAMRRDRSDPRTT